MTPQILSIEHLARRVFPGIVTQGQHPVLALVIWFFPLLIWSSLWLTFQSGDIHQLWRPDSTSGFFREGIRSAIPALGAVWALARIFSDVLAKRLKRIPYFSPLGFTIIYGAVGFVSSLLSPAAPVALYWAGIYISVPIILCALILGSVGVARLHLLLSFTWLVFLAAASFLFVFALIKLNLVNSILNPIDLYQCKDIGHWHTFTGGVLRSTGVGRYAAIAGIIAFSFLWRASDNQSSNQKWSNKCLWAGLFAGAIILLLSTGARTSILGFGLGILAVFLFQGRKRTLGVVGVAFGISVILAWGTGFQNGFLNGCIFNNTVVAPKTAPSITSTQIKSEPISSSPTPTHEPTLIAPTPTVSSKFQPPAVIQPAPTKVLPSQTNPQSERSSRPLVIPTQTGPRSQPETPIHTGVPPAKTDRPIKLTPPDERDTATQSKQLKEHLTNHSGIDIFGLIQIPGDFFGFSGRTKIWKSGLITIEDSPILGYGFHADRLILKNHMHNSIMQALIQTGILGASFFISALLLAWIMLLKILKRTRDLSNSEKHNVILIAGLLAFLSFRTIPESTGAFFGVDWMILAPIYLYIEVVFRSLSSKQAAASE